MPEPRQTPVFSRREVEVGFQFAEVRASSVAARAYCVNLAVLWTSCV